MTRSSDAGSEGEVRLRRHGRLTPAVRDEVLVSVSVGPAGEAVAMWAGPADRQALHTGKAEDRPVAVRVTTHGCGTDAVVSIAALGMAFCTAQPLPDGRMLVAALRGGAATVFDADGAPVRQGDIRDGIEHIRTTPTGRIWVGYFDEGVYGGDPVAHHGIVRFTDDLQPDWMFPFDSGFGPVDDCYALNVVGETAWSCYYNGFSIVRLADQRVTGWVNRDVAGGAALMVDGDRCALVGCFHPAGHRLAAIGRLADSQYEPTGERLLTLPDGQPLPPYTPYVGHGPDLHAFVGTTWYRLSLDDLT